MHNKPNPHKKQGQKEKNTVNILKNYKLVSK